MHQKHFLSNLNVLEYNRFIELVCCKKNIFLFLIFCPLEFFENLTFKWVPLIGFWIKIFYFIFKIHFTPRGTKNNLPFLNTQNRPTLMVALL